MDNYKQLLTYALKKLARREHSMYELRRALVLKVALLSNSTSEQQVLVERVAQECKQQNYQSDVRFAQAIMRHYTSQQKGAYAIMQQLQAHHISEEIRNTITDDYDYHHEQTMAHLLFAKKTNGDSSAQAVARGLHFLQQRGFSHDAITSVRNKMSGID